MTKGERILYAIHIGIQRRRPATAIDSTYHLGDPALLAYRLSYDGVTNPLWIWVEGGRVKVGCGRKLVMSKSVNDIDVPDYGDLERWWLVDSVIDWIG